jgi:hypothetical protein
LKQKKAEPFLTLPLSNFQKMLKPDTEFFENILLPVYTVIILFAPAPATYCTVSFFFGNRITPFPFATPVAARIGFTRSSVFN